MPEISTENLALNAYEASAEYYKAALQRCEPDNEEKCKALYMSALSVVAAIKADIALQALARSILAKSIERGEQ